MNWVGRGGELYANRGEVDKYQTSAGSFEPTVMWFHPQIDALHCVAQCPR